MKSRALGKIGLSVTEIGFGGASIGNLYKAVDNAQADQAIRAAWDAGIRYFDTAPQYGHGLSEHRLSYTLREFPRDEFVVSTKAGKILEPAKGEIVSDEEWFIDHLPFNVIHDYSYDAIMRSVEHSMQRMGMNTLDIIHIHDLDNIVLGDDFPSMFKTAMESGYKALDELRQAGVIKAVSLGIKEWEVCRQAMNYGDFDCFMLQGNYTLLEQQAKDFLDECHKKNIAILQAGPFSSGILVKGPVEGAKHHHTAAEKAVIDKVKKIQATCEAHGVPMPAAALQFPLTHPAVASVVIGLRSPEQVQMNMEWYNTPVPGALWDELNALI